MEEQKAEAPAAAPAKGRGMWIGIVVVVIVIVILLAAVLGGLFGGPAGPPGPGPERVLKIGTILTLSGTSGLEVFGPKNQRGALMAVSEINAAGGVLGNPIQVINEDDNGIDSRSADRARKLVTSDRVDAILGAVGSGKCAAVLEVTRPNSVVQISASCTSPIFSNLSYSEGWFFRTAPSDALQGVVAANYAFTNLSLRDMVVIGNNNPYGRGLANVFADEFDQLNGASPRPRVAIFAEGAATYSSDLQTLFGPTPPVAVYMANYPTDALKVMRDWQANPAWASIRWLFSEGVLEQAGFIDKLAAQGIDPKPFQGSAPGAYLGVVGANYAAFLTRYRAAYGEEDPGLFTANAYDAIYILAAAAEKAGTATGPAIKAQMRAVSNPPGTDVVTGEWAKIKAEIAAGRDINYDGGSGAANLDQFGDPLSGYGIWGVNATNRIITLALFDEATVIAMLGAPPLMVQAEARQPEWSVPTRPEET